MRQPTVDDIQEAISNKLWDFGNQVLYKLCAENPDHKSDDVIVAKVWLIGRSYAAAIERRRKTDGILGDRFYEKCVGPKIRSSEIDDWFGALRNASNVDVLMGLQIHKKVMGLFSEIANQEKPSLTSKYLHFHFPTRFYIYDSRAAKAIAALTKPIAPSPGYDDLYARFFARCEALNKQMTPILGRGLSPREIDKVLLHTASSAGLQQDLSSASQDPRDESN